jgi:hypothetical protein
VAGSGCGTASSVSAVMAGRASRPSASAGVGRSGVQVRRGAAACAFEGCPSTHSRHWLHSIRSAFLGDRDFRL